MKRFALAIMAFALIAATTGCNTMQGIGEDIQSGGQAIQKAATKK